MRGILALLIMLASASPALAVESYVCIADQSTGHVFNHSTKSWQQTSFNITGKKYLLKGDGKIWTWGAFGETYVMKCMEINSAGYVFCSDGFGDVRFNRKTLRYQSVYFIGYVN